MQRDDRPPKLTSLLMAVPFWGHGPRVSHIVGLYLITFLCGLVDATCFLSLGKVFAEMMTGNLLLFSFYLGSGHSAFGDPSYPIALGSFVVGAVAGGHIVRSRHGHTRLGFAVEWVFLAAAALLSLLLPLGSSEVATDIVLALLALAMGLQNALMRRHGVPDLATNVMTLTLTALVADSVRVDGRDERWQRRLASIGLFMLGAAMGAALTRTAGPPVPLLLALLVFSVALTGLTRQDS